MRQARAFAALTAEGGGHAVLGRNDVSRPFQKFRGQPGRNR